MRPRPDIPNSHGLIRGSGDQLLHAGAQNTLEEIRVMRHELMFQFKGLWIFIYGKQWQRGRSREEKW